MPVLATFTYAQSPRFTMRRGYLWGCVFAWFDFDWVQRGQEMILQEGAFGGYKVHARFSDSFWSGASNSTSADHLFSDFYAVAPGGGPPINAGTWTVGYQIDTIHKLPVVVLASAPNDNCYQWTDFPDINTGTWRPPFNPAPLTPFSYSPITGTPC
jgi:hypothetical protein